MRAGACSYERRCVELRKVKVLDTFDVRGDTLQMRDLCTTMRNHSIFEV